MRTKIASMVLLILALCANIVFGGDDRWEIKLRDSYGNNNSNSNPYGSTDIEMKKKYDPDPSTKYRGTLDNDGSVRMRDYNGNTLKGTIDNDGYSRLRDQDGNTIRVRPR